MIKLRVFYNILLIFGFLLISRLAYLQLISKKYIISAFKISVKKEIIYPERGGIFDKYGSLIVYNQSLYELQIIPLYINKNFNIKAFCKFIDISEYNFIKNLNKAKTYSKYIPYTVLSYIPKEQVAFIQEKLHNYKGIFLLKKQLREYYVSSMSNILGYIKEVELAQIKKDPFYYKIGDFIGCSGVEQSYEKILRGKKGIKYWLKNINGSIIGSYNQGKNDLKSIKGDDVYLTIDLGLQDYAEKLMYKKKGGIVAIDPNNGDILVLVSSPLLNPNLFIGENKSKNIIKLINNNIDNPLFDKATQGLYPPGSSFKVLTELVGLQMGVINKYTTFTCNHGFKYGKKIINCHCGFYNHPMNIEKAIALSCNNYFAQVYKKILQKYPKNISKGVDEWSELIKSFGLGNYLNNDLSTGYKGMIPSGEFYNKKYPKGWNLFTTISNSIGQGEIDVTPIQLANMTAAIANRGFFYTPHIVKAINNKVILNNKFLKPKYTKIDKIYFEPIIRGMEKVFINGTAKELKVSNINMAGKTGTAQNYTKYLGGNVSLADHSIFTLFAPIKHPKIAIAVMVENAGFGSSWAGPIATLIAEKYINKNIIRKDLENRMMTSGLSKIYQNIFFLKKNHKK